MRLEPDLSKQKFTFDGDDFALEGVIDGLRNGTLPLYKLNLNDADRTFMDVFLEEFMELADSLDENSPEGRAADKLYNTLRLPRVNASRLPEVYFKIPIRLVFVIRRCYFDCPRFPA
jgi:hypothetical protein